MRRQTTTDSLILNPAPPGKMVDFPDVESDVLSFEEFHRSIRESARLNPDLQLVKPDSLRIKWAQRVLKYCANVCYLDLYREPKPWTRKSSRSGVSLKPTILGSDEDYCKLNQTEASRRLASWSQYVFIFASYMVMKLIISVFLQHNFDRKWFKLKVLANSCWAGEGASKLMFMDFRQVTNISCASAGLDESVNKQWRMLHSEYMEARSKLKLIGSPYLNLNFPVECAYIFIIVINLAAYHGRIIYSSFIGHFDLSALRMILALPSQRDANFELVRQQANSFISSSWAFARISWDHLSLVRGPQARSKWVDNQGSKFIKEELLISLMEHRQCVAQLKRLATDGSLQPFNKTQTAIKHNALACLLLMSLAFTGLTIFHLGLTQLLPHTKLYSDFRFELDPMDILLYIELPLILTLDAHLVSISFVLPTISCIDQIFYVNKVRRSIASCKDKVIKIKRMAGTHGLAESHITTRTKTSSQRGALKDSGRKTLEDKGLLYKRRGKSLSMDEMVLDDANKAGESPRAQLTSVLLPTLMGYKIFVAQLEPLKRTFGASALLSFIVATTIPLLCRSYYHYLDPVSRMIIAGIALGFEVTISSSFLPQCELHCRCLDMHRELSSLLAHTVDAYSVARQHAISYSEDSVCHDGRCHVMADKVGPTDSHIIGLLRKELSHSGRFTVKSLGVPITYSAIIKLHLWLGILVIPTILIDSSQGGLPYERALGFF